LIEHGLTSAPTQYIGLGYTADGTASDKAGAQDILFGVGLLAIRGRIVEMMSVNKRLFI